MLDVHLYKSIIVKILYSDSWILSRTHYGIAKYLRQTTRHCVHLFSLESQ
jgi:hypothetical protein